MTEGNDRRPLDPRADNTGARVDALEMMVVILLSKMEQADFGLLDSMKDEVAQLRSTPSRRESPHASATDVAAASLIERALKAASATAGPTYRWKLRARRAVQKWRGARPPL